jgi:predicted AlkP superfamily pyrophosphatase or phosphodiesterase
MTERFCGSILQERSPAVAILWLSEPDHTGHHAPLGSPEHRAAIAAADRCVRRVLETVARLDPSGESILRIVCSDHGMETIRRVVDVRAALVAAGFKESLESHDVVVAPQGFSALIHFSPAAQGRIAAVERWLLSQDFSGRVIAGQDLSAIGLAAGGSLGIAVSMKYEPTLNAFGVEGSCDVAANPLGGETTPGFGQHGGLGPHEKNALLYVQCPGVAPGGHDHPASLIDIAPTVLLHLGLACEGVDGRPLQV